MALSLFSYPNEIARFREKLEDIWIRIEDRRSFSLELSFMRAVGEYERKFLNKLFGDKLNSQKAVGASSCLTIISLSLSLLLIANYQKHILLTGLGYLAIGGLVALVLNCMMGEDNKLRGLILTILGAFVILAWLKTQNSVYAGKTAEIRTIMAALLAIGALCDIGFIMLTRKLVDKVAESTRLDQLLVVVFLNLLVAFVMLGPGIFISSRTYSGANEAVYESIAIVSLSNIFDASLAFLFVILALGFLIMYYNRRLVSRVLYRLTVLDAPRLGRLALLTGVFLVFEVVRSTNFDGFLRNLVKIFTG